MVGINDVKFERRRSTPTVLAFSYNLADAHVMDFTACIAFIALFPSMVVVHYKYEEKKDCGVLLLRYPPHVVKIPSGRRNFDAR